VNDINCSVFCLPVGYYDNTTRVIISLIVANFMTCFQRNIQWRIKP